MNKHLHRIIFNANRGQLMVVAECATSQGKDASGERGATSGGVGVVMASRLTSLRPVCLGVLASLGMVLFTAGLSTGSSAQAQIVVDRNAPSNQRPTVLTSGNGVPVVNIQTPSAGGVSRNTYSQFDVNGIGVILNNSRVNTPTQLGGYVQGNPWLANGGARVILNEVNSSALSQLRGYIEVGGQRAEVIVANPAGVAIDGAGFINASRVTVTTGSPIVNGGSLDGYLVQRGQVTINGKGLDTSTADYTAILARAVQVNGGIWAKELNITAGTNQISASEGGAPAVSGSAQGQGAAPLFALDVSALGGMYAGKILLIGTEAGVGVRSAGTIGASAGQVQISVDGMLTNGGSVQAANAAGNPADIVINTTGAVQNSGTIYAAGSTNIAAVGSITNSGFIAAQNNTTVLASGAGALINATTGSVTASGLNANGSLRSTGDLIIAASTSVAMQGTSASAGSTSVSGTQLNLSDARASGANLALTATNGNLDASRASVNTQGTLSASTDQVLRTNGAKIEGSQITVNAHDVSNVAGQITQYGSGDLRIALTGNLDNTSGRIATNSQNMSLGTATLTNTDGTIEHAGSGTLAINATTLNGQRGSIISNGALLVNAGAVNLNSATTSAAQITLNTTTLSNRLGTISQTGIGQTTLAAGQALDNTAGKIETNGSAAISAAVLINARGRITTTKNATVLASSSLDNTDGTIGAAQNITLTGGMINNTRGNLQAAAGNATLQVTDLNNTAGSVFAGANLSANATSMTNTGSLYAAGRQTLNVTGAINNTGTIAALGDTTLTANSLNSGASGLLGAGIKADGSLATNGKLSVTTVQGLTALGQNLAAGDAALSGATVDLTASQTSAVNIALTATSGEVITSKATVTAQAALAVDARGQSNASWINNKGVVSAGQLNARVASLNNTFGEIVQTGTGNTSIALTSATGVLDNASGRIAVNSANLTLSANTLTNTDGTIQQAGVGTLAINANALNDQRGRITGNGALAITAGAIDHQNASTLAQRITVTAASLDNRQGDITQLGNADTAITTSGLLDNRAGTIASNGNTTLNAQSINNQGGKIQAAGAQNISITTTGALDNSSLGGIAAGGNATLVTGSIANSQGKITAGDNLSASANAAINNTQGLMAATRDVAVNAASLDNTRGTVAAVQGNIVATTASLTINDSGKIQATGDVTLTTGGVSNTLAAGQTTAGSITGQNVSIQTNNQGLNNHLGTIAATQVGDLQTDALNNDAGLVQAGTALLINTHGQALTNTNAGGYTSLNPSSAGGITSGGTLALNTAGLNNAAGYVGAVGAISGSTGQIDNTAAGQIAGKSSVDLTIAGLNNQGGQVQVIGDLSLNASNGTIDNRSGLLRSGGAVNLTATTVDNRSTLGTDQGIEGNNIALNTVTLNNTLGAVRADNNATITSAGSINNSQGLISAGNVLTVQDGDAVRTLAITNTAGTLISGKNTVVRAASLTGDGKVLGQQDLSIDLTTDYTHSAGAEIAANRNASFATTGNLTNSGKFQASGILSVIANDIDNAATGDINGGITKVTANQTLTNRGVIDGSDTQINATTLNNSGTGRIYGDDISIQASTLTNAPENGTAATIAARQNLEIGAQTITNSEHSLIFSAGNIRVGASLGANRAATGQAGVLNNNSATIEALGNLNLGAIQLNNTNEHFAYAQQVTSVQYGVREDINPRLYRVFTRTTYTPTQTSSDPANILAGGNLTINSQTPVNANSHIVAGGALTVAGNAIQNTSVIADKLVVDSGNTFTLVHFPQTGTCGKLIKINCVRAHDDWVAGPYYIASPYSVTVSQLTPQQLSGKTIEPASPVTVSDNTGAASLTIASVNVAAIGRVLINFSPVNTASGPGAAAAQGTQGPALAHVNPITQVTLASPSGNAQVVRTAVPTVQIPNTSLFKVNPNPSANFLIETDSRFSNYRQWLGSDYLLTQLQLDPTVTQKRLGDGFYEQKLVREQLMALTGQRFTDNYTSDEAQYRALMDGGVTYAKAHNLRPGIALSAAQMAVLTADIVWLVEQEVTLPNGQTTKALVPQVYVRVKPGDLNGSGALLAGKEVNINLTGDLANTGTVAGRSIVRLNANNVNNLGGRINGDAVAINAKTDLNNIGGTISANDQLQITAGRDINVQTTTRSTSSTAGASSFSRTSIDRVAGLYVSNPGGTLVASAGRDTNIVGGVVANAGQDGSTALSAGRNLNLATITTAQSNRIIWTAKNTLSYGESTEVGSQVQGAGRINLAAGQDINARAATVQASTTLVVRADNNINITAAQNTAYLDEAHQQTSKGFLSKTTTTTRDTNQSSTAAGSTLEGQNVVLKAGNDITVKGSNVVSDDQTTLIAKNNITIEAAQNTSSSSSFKDQKSSGLMGGGGASVFIGKKQNSTDQKDQTTTASASTIGSINGNVDLQAGQTYRQVGSDVLAPKGDINILAKNVEIIEARETTATQTETKSKQSGLTVAISSPVVSAIQSAQGMAQAAKNTSSGRMKLLAAGSTALNLYSNAEGIGSAATALAKGDLKNAGSISLSLGSSKSQSNSTSTSNTARGSTVAAGNNVNITATGAGTNSNLLIQGSDIKAGNNASLSADNQINLLAAKNETTDKTTNSSSSGSIGVSLSAQGLSATASASKGKGKSDGQGISYTNSQITAGNTVSIESGADTNIKGAVVAANQIKADVGGSLTVQSLQDTNTYTASQKSSGFSISVPITGGDFGASVSASKSKIDSNFQSANEQSGLKAGDGGFQVSVANNTSLSGGVISSTQTAVDSKVNTFTTGGQLTITDVQNTAN